MDFLDKKVLERVWWYGLNILTTLFIISFVNVNGPKGNDGLPGQDGVNGVDGGSNNTYPVTPLAYEAMPTGAARAAYVQSLLLQGYTPIDSAEDFALFSVSPFAETDIYALGNREAYDNKKYVLTADIDFSTVENIYDSFIRGYYQVEGGGDNLVFSGIFDGAGYAINNFAFHTGESDISAAFFPYTGNAVIKNIVFNDLEISSVLSSAGNGAVVGTVTGPTLLQNITVNNAEVISDNSTGGIVGAAEDHIYLVNVNNLDGVVYGYDVGGLVGKSDYNYQVFIQDSLNTSDIDETLVDNQWIDYVSGDHAGGLIGFVENSESVIILNSANTGNVLLYDADSGEVGGLIGFVDYSELTVIANSFNSGRVETDDAEAGGLIGDINSEHPTFIQNSFNAGPIYSTTYATAGLIGEIGSNEGNDYASPVFITNSYNAGYIASSEYGDEKGGLVGEVNGNRHVVITDSFNVGKFSVGIVSHDAGIQFPDNGAIVGDSNGLVTLDNVAFYVDEANIDNYYQHAIDGNLALGATRITDLDAFTSEDFIYEAAWNFSTIWTFVSGDYAFPVLRNLPSVDMAESGSYAPFIDYIWFNFVSVFFDDELLENVIGFDWYSAEYADAETALEDLVVKLYASLVELNDVESILEEADVAHEFDQPILSDEEQDADNPEFIYVPTLGEGTYYFYLVVTDMDGNSTFERVAEVVYEFADNLLPPVPGANGAFSATFAGGNIGQVNITYTPATDDTTDPSDLQYAFVIFENSFDISTWDYNVDHPSVLFAVDFSGVTLTEFNIASVGVELSYNTNYQAALFVSDDDYLVSVYQIVDLILID